MMRSSAAIFALLLATGAVAQDKKDVDKIGKDKAQAVLKKVLTEYQKKKNAAISETAEMATGPRKQTSTFDGVLRKDFSAVKGSAEIYAKGAVTLVNTGGRFDPPEDLQGQDGIGAQGFKNPSLLVEEAGKVASPAQYGQDEMVDGKDCKTIDIQADPAMLRAQLKEFGERLNRSFKSQIGFAGAQVFDFKNMLDEKGSMATYHLAVGKDDLMIYRIQYVIRPKIKPGSAPPMLRLPEDMDQKVDVKFSKWDEDAPFDVPGVVKAKLGVK